MSHQLHKPVLLLEVEKAFLEHFDSEQKIFGLDGTFGRGGHYRHLKKVFPQMSVLALDQDQEAIDFARTEFAEEQKNGSLRVAHLNFSDAEKITPLIKEPLDFVFLDIGVSSPQLDQPERGFSFYKDGPLDMRMDQSQGITAAEVLNTYSLENLREVFLKFGEVYAPQKLLEALKSFREEKPFETTLEFANLVEKIIKWRKKGSHPATLYFQGLRVYVNRELPSLEAALDYFVGALRPGGIFLVISFHSLEDRMVKHFFRGSELGKPVNKKVIKPSDLEVKENVRARSSKLRVFKKFEEGVPDVRK